MYNMNTKLVNTKECKHATIYSIDVTITGSNIPECMCHATKEIKNSIIVLIKYNNEWSIRTQSSGTIHASHHYYLMDWTSEIGELQEIYFGTRKYDDNCERLVKAEFIKITNMKKAINYFRNSCNI